MDLEIIIVCKVSQTERQRSYDFTYVEFRNDTVNLFTRTEIDSEMQKTNSWFGKVGKRQIRSWVADTLLCIKKEIKQQGPTV